MEFALLRRAVSSRIGPVPFATGYIVTLYGAALIAAALSWGLRYTWGLGTPGRLPSLAIIATYGIAYLVLTTLLGVPEARELVSKLARRARFRVDMR